MAVVAVGEQGLQSCRHLQAAGGERAQVEQGCGLLQVPWPERQPVRRWRCVAVLAAGIVSHRFRLGCSDGADGRAAPALSLLVGAISLTEESTRISALCT